MGPVVASAQRSRVDSIRETPARSKPHSPRIWPDSGLIRCDLKVCVTSTASGGPISRRPSSCSSWKVRRRRWKICSKVQRGTCGFAAVCEPHPVVIQCCGRGGRPVVAVQRVGGDGSIGIGARRCRAGPGDRQTVWGSGRGFAGLVRGSGVAASGRLPHSHPVKLSLIEISAYSRSAISRRNEPGWPFHRTWSSARQDGFAGL